MLEILFVADNIFSGRLLRTSSSCGQKESDKGIKRGQKESTLFLLPSFDPFRPFHMTHLLFRHHWPFVLRIHRWPMDFPHNGPVIRKVFPCGVCFHTSEISAGWEDSTIDSYLEMVGSSVSLINFFWLTLKKAPKSRQWQCVRGIHRRDVPPKGQAMWTPSCYFTPPCTHITTHPYPLVCEWIF